MTATTAAVSELATLFRARCGLVWVATDEEERAERGIVGAARAAFGPGARVISWDCVAGLSRTADGSAVDGGIQMPAAAVQFATEIDGRGPLVIILRDVSAWIGDPVLRRALRNAARDLPLVPLDAGDDRRVIVILDPERRIPPDLADCAARLTWPLPDREELTEMLRDAEASIPDAPNSPTRRAPDAACADAAAGLTGNAAQTAYACSIVATGQVDPERVAARKREVVAADGLLTWIEPGGAALGGLSRLVRWLDSRRVLMKPEAADCGMRPPRGLLLVGVPGCGKSLAARTIGMRWRIPTLRLDLGALRSKYVGESEERIRRALQMAETVAPCVLWVDEIEKALGGAAGSGATDGGVSTDALGALLTWLQDHDSPVFTCATANDVRALPPELLRRGRFDATFFVDVPTTAERVAISQAAIYGRFQPTEDYLDAISIAKCAEPDAIAAALAQLTSGMTGAEIEAVIGDALVMAYSRGPDSKVTLDDVRAAAADIRPVTQSLGARLVDLRSWAQANAIPASDPETVSAPRRRELRVEGGI